MGDFVNSAQYLVKENHTPLREWFIQRSNLDDSDILVNIHELESHGLKALFDHMRKSF